MAPSPARTVVRSLDEFRDLRRSWITGGRGASVGLVPTMGAFHEGHVSLIRAARAENERLVVSLFVNPAQFGLAEDLARYPRDEARDAAIAQAEGVDALLAPSAEEMYPAGFATWVDVGALGTILEGAVRPGHFRGVATVCLKLFELVQPTRAYFGRKDAQQVAVLRQMVRDLDLPLALRVLPTIRAADGLALSSRNAQLSPEERTSALALPRALEAGLAAHRAGGDAVAAAEAVLAAEPGLTVDYVAQADLDGPTLTLAVRAGRTRLIDNILLSEAQP